MSEFNHYDGCNFTDPDNCSACALTNTDQKEPNYSGWPLIYIETRRKIPRKWLGALLKELCRTDNDAYVNNLKSKILTYGIMSE